MDEYMVYVDAIDHAGAQKFIQNALTIEDYQSIKMQGRPFKNLKCI